MSIKKHDRTASLKRTIRQQADIITAWHRAIGRQYKLITKLEREVVLLEGEIEALTHGRIAELEIEVALLEGEIEVLTHE